MADFNTDVVKIGKSANRSGGGAQGSDVIVGTEKKFGGLNVYSPINFQSVLAKVFVLTRCAL